MLQIPTLIATFALWENRRNYMNMLGDIFTVGLAIAGAFLIWLYTKPGKKWLENL